MLLILVIAAAIGLIPAAIASSKGHSFGLWWLFGAGLWVVALPCALVLKPVAGRDEALALASGSGRKCPHCAEVIKFEAKVCRHCGRDVPPATYVNPYAHLPSYSAPGAKPPATARPRPLNLES